jgi:hypothetical protein
LVDRSAGAVFGGAAALRAVRAEVAVVDLVVHDVPVGDQQVVAGWRRSPWAGRGGRGCGRGVRRRPWTRLRCRPAGVTTIGGADQNGIDEQDQATWRCLAVGVLALRVEAARPPARPCSAVTGVETASPDDGGLEPDLGRTAPRTQANAALRCKDYAGGGLPVASRPCRRPLRASCRCGRPSL